MRWVVFTILCQWVILELCGKLCPPLERSSVLRSGVISPFLRDEEEDSYVNARNTDDMHVEPIFLLGLVL